VGYRAKGFADYYNEFKKSTSKDPPYIATKEQLQLLQGLSKGNFNSSGTFLFSDFPITFL